MKRFRDKRKVISLSLVGIAYALIVTPLIISNINKQQEIRSRAQVAQPTTNAELTSGDVTESAQAQCTYKGIGEIGVGYTNTDQSRSIQVIATDESSGLTADLGTIAPQETKTGIIAINKSTIASGTVKYTVAFTDSPTQTTQKTTTYGTRICQNYSTQLSQATADVPATCGNVTTDIVLIIDRSGSMSQASKLIQAKNAAKNFIDVVSNQESTTRVGLVSFSTNSTLDNTLTTDYNAVKTKVDSLVASGNTCQECGITQANQEIATHGRAGVKKVVVMLTDGQANWIVGGTSQVDATTGETKALNAVKSGFAASKTVFFTIGLGDQNTTGDGKFFSPDYMRQVATLTGGQFYFPAPSELDGVYQQISQLIGKGLIGGFVFNDANLNGAFDTNETKLSGWTVQATSSAGVKSAVSNASGNYVIGGLCEGTYKVSEVAKTGFTQTLPANNAGYTVNIVNASQFNDKLFGNTDKARCEDNLDNDSNGFKDSTDSTCHTDRNPKNPGSYNPKLDGEHGGGNTCADSKDNNGDGTIDGGDPVCHTDHNPANPGTYNPSLPEISPTPTPGLTYMSLSVQLDGIGSRGDNTNPTDSSLSNKNPKHPVVGADIQIYNLDNQLVASGTGTITYNATGGNYIGDVPIQRGFPGGKYTVKVKADTYLRKLVTGIQTFVENQKNVISPVSLIAGDVNNDNKLNILDYNSILDCYSDLVAAVNCPSAAKSISSDLNDDGGVNQIDYNLFLREISTQPGQ